MLEDQQNLSKGGFWSEDRRSSFVVVFPSGILDNESMKHSDGEAIDVFPSTTNDAHHEHAGVVWDKSDYNGYKSLIQQGTGQINLDSILGKYLYDIASNDNYYSFLEIGTWNGLGSTKCFIEGFKNRNTPHLFYSLECNSEKSAFAKDLYENIENVFILNEVIINSMPDDIYTLFPELLTNADFKYWNTIDFSNMCDKPLFLERKELPKIFDVIFLDGGEFTTWYEYQQLKDRCKIIIMDDTLTSKCKHILSELKNQPDKWEIIFESDERNGCAGFKNLHM